MDTTEVTHTEESGDKLDNIINSAIDQVEAKSAPEAAPVTSEKTEKTEFKVDATGRAHAPDGKFAPKISAEPEAPKGPAEGKANPAPEPAAEPAPEAQSVQPPTKWSESEKAEFAKLPRPIQEWLVKRDGETEASFTRKTQELADTRKAIEPLLKEVETLNPVFQRFSMTPHQFLRESAIVADRLSSGLPQQQGQALAYLAQLHRIPPEAVLTALGIPVSQAGEGGVAVDPVITQLHQQVSDLTRQLHGLKEQSALVERSKAEAEFNALAHTKDDSGNLKYPHFERVKQTMIRLVANEQADTWDAAYSKSVRLDDDLYKQTVETERKRALDEQEKQRAEAVQKAKGAAPVKTSTGSPNGATSLKGLDAHLSAAMDRHQLGA